MSHIPDFRIGDSYYEALGVSHRASAEEIKHAWRQTIKHIRSSDTVSEEKYEYVVDAGEVLTNIEKRRVYDELGHDTFIANCGRRGNEVDDITSVVKYETGTKQTDSNSSHSSPEGKQEGENSRRSDSDGSMSASSALVDYAENDSPLKRTRDHTQPGDDETSRKGVESNSPHWRYEDGEKVQRRAQKAVKYTPPSKLMEQFVLRPISTRLIIVGALTIMFLIYIMLQNILGTGQGLVWLLLFVPTVLLITRGLESYILYASKVSDNIDFQRAKNKLSTRKARLSLWGVFTGLVATVFFLETSALSHRETLIVAFDASNIVFAGVATGVLMFALTGFFGTRLAATISSVTASTERVMVSSGIIGGVVTILLLSTSLINGSRVFMHHPGVTTLPWTFSDGVVILGVNIGVVLSFVATLIITISMTAGVLLTIPLVMTIAHNHITNDHYIIPGLWEVFVTMPVIIFLWMLFVIYTGGAEASTIKTTVTGNGGIITLILLLMTVVLIFLLRSHIEPRYSEWRESQVSQGYTSRR